MSAPTVAGAAALNAPAAALLGRVVTDPAAPLYAAISAPGGYGKTTLLREVDRAYRRAGVPVTTPWQPATEPGEPVLLVDDAHLLDEDRLRELRRQAERPDTRIVIAYRPWPRPPGLSQLTDVLRRGRPPVTLPALFGDEIRARLAAALDRPPAPALVGFVATQSGGVPRYVSRLIAALTGPHPALGPARSLPGAASAGSLPGAGSAGSAGSLSVAALAGSRLVSALTGADGSPRIPAAALAPFAAELDELDPDLRTLLLAVEAGAGLSFDLIAALLDRDADTVAELAASGQATGMLATDGTLVPLARHALAALGPIAKRIDVRQRLAALQLARGGPVLPLVRPLLPPTTDDRAAAAGLALGESDTGAGLMPGGAGSALMPGGSVFASGGAGLVPGGAARGLVPGGAISGLVPGGAGSAFGPGGAAPGLVPADAAPGLVSGGASGLVPGGPGASLVPGGAGSVFGPGGVGPGLVPGGAGSGLGPVFEAAGEEALGDDPALAARLFAAAAGAGRPAMARRALATALSGDLDQAARLADQSLAVGPADQRAEAAYVAAVALAHRGQLARAVELYQWARPSTAAGFEAVGLVGTGRLAEAERFTTSPPAGPEAGFGAALEAVPGGGPGGGPPTLLSATASLMARGVCESITSSPAAALSTLVQASALLEPAGAAVLLPDSPAALAALLGMHCADLDTTDAILERAGRAGLGGPLLAPRHQLLQAWSMMLRGRMTAAEQRLTEAIAAGDTGPVGGVSPVGGVGGPVGGVGGPVGVGSIAGRVPLRGRDLLFAAALRVGLARRNSDLVGLRAVWPDACQVLIGQPVDLFTLLPLGELAVAAARLGEYRRVVAPLEAADRLLGQLGDPPLWSVPLHWSRLHAAILADDPAAAERHAVALEGLREHGPYAAALAAAAQSWLAVLADRIDPDDVEAAARELAAHGLTWDAARLAGQAAIRTSDRKAMTALLDCARLLQGRPVEARRAADVPEQLLSEREREVAALVLAGLTYKQVADRLYLSAKTVEHHMARIRQRLGVTDRRELLIRLRALTADTSSGSEA